MELRDGQSQRIDGFVLRIDSCLFADLFGIEIVSHAEYPMLRPRLLGIERRIELVDGYERGSAGHVAPWTVSWDMEVIVTFLTSTSLCSI